MDLLSLICASTQDLAFLSALWQHLPCQMIFYVLCWWTENPNLIWLSMEVQAVLIWVLNWKKKKTSSDSQPHNAFSCIRPYSFLSFLTADHYEDIFPYFNYPLKAIGIPEMSNKASVSQSPAVEACTYVYLKLKVSLLFRHSFKAHTVALQEIAVSFEGTFPPLTVIFSPTWNWLNNSSSAWAPKSVLFHHQWPKIAFVSGTECDIYVQMFSQIYTEDVSVPSHPE